MAGTELMGKSTGKSRIAAGRLGQGEASFVQVIYSFCAFVHPSDREVSSLSPLADRSGVFAYSNPAAPARKSRFLVPIPALGRILAITIIQTGFAERDDFRNGDSWETVMEPHLSHE